MFQFREKSKIPSWGGRLFGLIKQIWHPRGVNMMEGRMVSYPYSLGDLFHHITTTGMSYLYIVKGPIIILYWDPNNAVHKAYSWNHKITISSAMATVNYILWCKVCKLWVNMRNPCCSLCVSQVWQRIFSDVNCKHIQLRTCCDYRNSKLMKGGGADDKFVIHVVEKVYGKLSLRSQQGWLPHAIPAGFWQTSCLPHFFNKENQLY